MPGSLRQPDRLLLVHVSLRLQDLRSRLLPNRVRSGGELPQLSGKCRSTLCSVMVTHPYFDAIILYEYGIVWGSNWALCFLLFFNLVLSKSIV